MCNTQQSDSIPFDDIPFDIVEDILRHIPINPDLISAALASKQRIAPSILQSIPFARLHFRTQHSESKLGFWEFLDASGIQYERWLALPLTYKTAIYQEILTANDWEHAKTIPDPQNKSLMWPESSALPHDQALSIYRYLVDNHFDFTQQETRSIRWAAWNNQVELVKIMLKNPSIDPSVRGNIAFRIACQSGFLAIIHILLADPRVHPGTEAGDNNPIKVSSERGHLEIVERLLQDPRVDPTSQHSRSVRIACKNGHYEVVRLLLADGRADPSENNQQPIRDAAAKGSTALVELLLKDPRVDPTVGHSNPLRCAAASGHVETVELLLKDQRVNAADRENYAIRVAAQKGHAGVIRLLLDQPGVNPATDNNCAIRLATQHGHIETVKLLIQDPRVTVAGDVILGLAVQSGHSEMAKLLLAHPIVRNSVDLKSAAAAGKIGIVKILLADTSLIPKMDGSAAMMAALKNGQMEVFNLLLERFSADF